MAESKLFWLGNIAKTKVISEIVASSAEKNLRVFDYGCGDAGDWPQILTQYPNLELIGYEPFPKSFEAARQRLAGVRARILTGNELLSQDFVADFVVSFSVFEHVYDRPGYLRTAKKHLADDGLFVLNYDDGHFRARLDLERPASWPGEIRTWMHNLVADPLAKMGFQNHYQKRVLRDYADRLVDEAGFRIDRSEYNNLMGFKSLFKTLPAGQQGNFARFWLATEAALNDRFLANGGPYGGDPANLWREMSSRTLYLRHR